VSRFQSACLGSWPRCALHAPACISAAALLVAIFLAPAVARAQNSTQTLDATSGTATSAQNYTTGTSGTAALTLDLGFYVDYLIVGGGGGGGGDNAGGGAAGGCSRMSAARSSA